MVRLVKVLVSYRNSFRALTSRTRKTNAWRIDTGMTRLAVAMIYGKFTSVVCVNTS